MQWKLLPYLDSQFRHTLEREREGIEAIFETPKVFIIFSIYKYIMIFVLQVISVAARNYWKVGGGQNTYNVCVGEKTHYKWHQ